MTNDKPLPVIDSEGTAHPIFLFQAKHYTVLDAPEGYEFDAEGDCIPIDWEDTEGDDYPDALTDEEISNYPIGDYDIPCAIAHWDTENVFLTREEGEAYGNSRAYNYPNGWRVYCVPARGTLCEGLKALRKINGLDT